MLPCKRDLFDIPRDVCYLNAAGWSPLPKASVEAGRTGVARKSQPWSMPASFAADEHERARIAAAGHLNADPADIALIPSIAYGVAVAGNVLPTPRGSRVLVLDDDHSSPVLEWMTRAERLGFTVEVIHRPGDGDWTTAVLESIERRGAKPISICSISSVHWSDGGALDLVPISAALKTTGGALLVDFTHGAGVMALDVRALDPDIVLFPTYKWMLGPYGRAFMYVAKRHQDGIPLEQTSHGRRDVRAEADTYLADLRYLPDARRYDMAERDHFVSLEMASIGMEMMSGWGQPAICERLAMITRRLADGLNGVAGIEIAGERVRAPHILCLGFSAGMPADFVDRLAAEKIYAARRLGRLRLSPHVYVDEADVDRFIGVVKRLMT